MPIQPTIRSPDTLRSSDAVRNFLLNEIRAGLLLPGHKLPTERVLAERFQISRTVVRDALTHLEAESHIVRHVGRGTFVAELTEKHGEPPVVDASPIKLLEARSVLEPELAGLAVLNATESDLRKIAAVSEALRKADTSAEFEVLDTAFHTAIATATHNALLEQAYEMISQARANPEWRKLKERRHSARPERREEVYREHQRVVDALEERSVADARRAMLDHIDRVRLNLIGG